MKSLGWILLVVGVIHAALVIGFGHWDWWNPDND